MAGAMTAARVIVTAAVAAARRVVAAGRVRRRRAHTTRNRRGMAVGTLRRRFTIANERFKIGATLIAFIFVDRHFTPAFLAEISAKM